MKRTRNFYVGVTIVAVIAVLAIAQYTLQTVARAQENGSANRAGIYEVDRMWPKPLPNNWVLGSTVGLAIDARDHVFIVHRGQASLDQKFASQMAFTPPAPRGGGGRAGAAAPPAGGFAAPSAGTTVTGYARERHDEADFRVLLRIGASGARVRSGGQSRPSLGRARRGLRVAALDARHHDRRQRQRVARRQRRTQHPEVLEGREVPSADRQERREQGQHGHRQREPPR